MSFSAKAFSPTAFLPAFSSGSFPLGSVPVPLGATVCQVLARRLNWASTGAEVCNVEIELSFDSGNNWSFLAGFGTHGGAHIRRDGSTATHSGVHIPLPNPELTTRVVRSTFICSTDLQSAVTFEFF